MGAEGGRWSERTARGVDGSRRDGGRPKVKYMGAEGDRWSERTARGVEGSRRDGGRPEVKWKCHRCGGPHLVRYCKEPPRCFRCDAVGHIAIYCEQRPAQGTQGQGNE